MAQMPCICLKSVCSMDKYCGFPLGGRVGSSKTYEGVGQGGGIITSARVSLLLIALHQHTPPVEGKIASEYMIPSNRSVLVKSDVD